MTTQDNELLEFVNECKQYERTRKTQDRLLQSINIVRSYIRDLEVQDCFEEFNWTDIDKALRTVKEDLIESQFCDGLNRTTIKKEGGDNDERS